MNSNEFWFSIIMLVGGLIFLKMVLSSIGFAIKMAVENKQHWGKNSNGIPPMFQKMTDRAMAERDEIIDSLEERIEVLEAIVTDQHNQSKTRELADEIDKLKK